MAVAQACGLLSNKLGYQLGLPYNLVVTNVPASRETIYFAKSKKVDCDAFGPLCDGARLPHVVTSYLGGQLSLDANAELLPDAKFSNAWRRRNRGCLTPRRLTRPRWASAAG